MLFTPTDNSLSPRRFYPGLVAESWAPGGQAGTSTRIENYLGFPTGISG